MDGNHGFIPTPTETSKFVKAAASDLGFDLCGIAPAQAIPRAAEYEAFLAEGRAGTMDYLHRHRASRIDVRAWLPAARSVVVLGLSYRQPAHPPPDDRPRGKVAMYAWGEDYHVVLAEKLETLARRLRQVYGERLLAKVCVDTSAVIERELATMAGLGWIGKNTLVLNHRIGSQFFLGEIITDLMLAPDAPRVDHCGTCTRCLDACPTGAFPRPYAMDARRCISYLTIEHRGVIDPALAEQVGEWVFGCDICQEVCPYNADAPPTREPRLVGDVRAAWPALDEIKVWDAAAYHAATAGRATDRATLAMWKRNAAMVRSATEPSARRNPGDQ